VSYFPLRIPSVVAAADQTGKNTGNLTNAFTTEDLPNGVAWFEVYHAVVTNVPPGGSATIMIGSKLWGYTNPLGGSEWDPSQPMLLQTSQEVYFLWNISATNPASKPVVTLWLRYDPSLPGNPPQPLTRL
jgi:hypothetical protein